MGNKVNQAEKNEYHILSFRHKSLRVDLKEAKNRPMLPERNREEGRERMGPRLHRRDSFSRLTNREMVTIAEDK